MSVYNKNKEGGSLPLEESRGPFAPGLSFTPSAGDTPATPPGEFPRGGAAISEWRECKLTEVTSLIGDGLHGTPVYDEAGEYYFINGNNLDNGKIIIKQDTKKVNQLEFSKHQKLLSKNTILLGINGTFGNLALYNNEKCILGKSACYINVGENVDKYFLYYNLLNVEFQTYLENIATGTTIPNVPLKGLREYSFLLPPLPEQRAIASVLSSLDDKIDLLHRQNKTLEAMAETLFRQWFVEEADERWEEGKLGQILSLIESGMRPKGGIDQNLQEGIPSIGAENINGIGKYDFSKTKFITQEFFSTMKRGIIKDFDVLIYKDGAYIGRKGMFGHNFPYGTCSINEHVFLLRCNERADQFFLYFLLQEDDLAQLNANSAQPGLNQESMKSLEIVIPPIDLINKFGLMVAPLIDKIFFNANQIRTLEKLRDTLLPKLMSGEVRVEVSE